MGPQTGSVRWGGWKRLALSLTVFAGTHAHGGERWATTIGYEPEHVIVDTHSTDAGRLEQSFPNRPRARRLDSGRMTLNNVGVQVSALLATLATAIPAEGPTHDQTAGATVTGDVGVPGPTCGAEDAAGVTLCVTSTGTLRAEDRARVQVFLGGPTLVLTADAPGRNAMAAALDSVAPAGRDVIVREDAARVRPGTVRIERRTP